jgi:hypothetical protein
MNQQGKVTKIPLTQGQFALIDKEYADEVNKYKWFSNWSPRMCSYRAVRTDRSGTRQKTISMNRFIWELVNGPIPIGLRIDHINGNTLDNRICNLRAVTNGQNIANSGRRRKGATYSKFVGVTWHKQKQKWVAKIQVNHRNKHLGYFDSEEAASNAYQKALAEIESKEQTDGVH